MSDSLCLHLRLEIPEFTKVGLRVDRKNRVISVASGSPAALAGLMPNDLIEQVEGLSLTAERGVQAALADRTTSAPLLRVRRGGGGRRAKPSRRRTSDEQPASEAEAGEEGNGEGGFETLLLSLSLKAGERAGMRVDANEVLTVAPDTPAAMAGLRAGDVVAEVDGVAVGEGGATTLLHALSDRSRPSRSLTVVRRRAASSKSASPATEDKAEGGLEEELLCVELSRDGAGSLGIKALQGGQIVSVMPGGAAASAGLAAGDDILEVDGEEVVGSSSGIFSLLPPAKADFSLLVRRRGAAGGGAASGRTDGASVQQFLGEYMSDVSASLSRSQDESALASHEESGRARAAAAAAAAGRAAFEASPLSELVGEALEEGEVPVSTRGVVLTAPRTVEAKNVSLPPTLGEGEVLVRLEVASLSTRDRDLFNGEQAAAQVLGQTAVGTVVALAPDVGGLRLGDAVVVSQGEDAFGSRGSGAQAGLVVRDAASEVFEVPAESLGPLDYDDVLIAADYLAPGMALARMAANGVDAPVGQGEKKRGSRCFAVFGCTPLGLMAVGALRLLAGDAAVILAVDRSATRRELALRYEATQALAPDRAAEALRRLDSGRGFDGVVEASGTAEGLAASFALLAAGGTLASLSAHPTELVPLPMRACCEKSARLCFGTRRAAARRLFPTALKLLRAKRFPVREVVTHRYSIDEAQEAYEAAADEAGDASAVFLYPSGQAREGAARALYSSLD